MFRLRLLRHLMKNCPQLATTQEFTSHHRSCVSKAAENQHTIDITSKLRPSVPLVEAPSERDFLVQLKNDPDTFGDPAEKEVVDEKDREEEKHFEDQPLPSQKLRPKQYAEMIKGFVRKRQIKEALNVLEVRMLQEDRVKPDSYIYNLLLGACGRVGYTKKAFSLYNQMKKRGLSVMGGTYTALFNACANSPWREDGLTRATHLRSIMIEKRHEPNDTNYNAMIKAFGRCGDLATAFTLVDEMVAKKFPIRDDTVNFLLQACIEDKEAGFRHALLVWRKVVDRGITPSVYTFNLMLRCTRDCGFGDVQVMTATLDRILNSDTLSLGGANKLLTGDTENKLEVGLVETLRPNLMAKVPHLGGIISLQEVKKAEDRLLLLGGLGGFLENMSQSGCSPDIKTFTQLLDCAPSTLAAEKELMRAMKIRNIKPDVAFFNMLIKKRSMRFDYENAKAVVVEMEKMNYRPNLLTYGVLSLGCKTKDEALHLLEEMKAHSYRLNTEILGAMLHQACYHKRFSYVLELMELSLREKVKPNKIFMECLENFKKTCKEISNDKSKGENASFQKNFRIFKMRYRTWLNEVEVDDTDQTHPWTQFRQTSETDGNFKDKVARFKPRHLSRFRVKTSTKRRNN